MLANNTQGRAIKTRVMVNAVVLFGCCLYGKMRETVNDNIFSEISCTFCIKNHLFYVKAEMCQQCSLGHWQAPEHHPVSHTVLAANLGLPSDFQLHICIKKAVPLRSREDKISKKWLLLCGLVFFTAPDFWVPKSCKTKKRPPLPLHDNQTILCLSWDSEMWRHPNSLTTFLLHYFLIQPCLHKLLFELPDILQRCLWGEALPRNHEDPIRQPTSERNVGSQSVWKLLVWWRHTMRQPLKHSSAAHVCDSRAIVNSTYLLNCMSCHVHSDS